MALPEATTFKLGGPEVHTVRAVRDQGREWSITVGRRWTGDSEDHQVGIHRLHQGQADDAQAGHGSHLRHARHGHLGLRGGSPDYAQVAARIMAALLKEFAAHDSMSVQHTLFDMGKAALAAAPEIASITLTMPNLHHLLADLSPFGQDNPNHIFVPIDEPHGYIEATIER
jgi:hypothetical protein